MFIFFGGKKGSESLVGDLSGPTYTTKCQKYKGVNVPLSTSRTRCSFARRFSRLWDLKQVASFHNQLKTNYLNRKVNRRVDFLVHHLLQFEKDAFFHYKKDCQLPPAIHKKVKLEMNHHERGLKISEKKVKVVWKMFKLYHSKINVI